MLAKLTGTTGAQFIVNSDFIREAVPEAGGGTRIVLDEPAFSKQSGSNWRTILVTEDLDAIVAAFKP